jgi:hypothetical protein
MKECEDDRAHGQMIYIGQVISRYRFNRVDLSMVRSSMNWEMPDAPLRLFVSKL